MFGLRGRSQNMLTRFWFYSTTYRPALTIVIVWTLTKSGHFKTTYLPRLVNIVCERPLIWPKKEWKINEINNFLSFVFSIFLVPMLTSTETVYFFCPENMKKTPSKGASLALTSEIAVLQKMARSSQTFENSHSYYNVSYT